jgi:hypothetical protein
MMTRRAVALIVALGLLTAPLAAEAQRPGNVPRIGFLQPGPSHPTRPEAFRQGLRDLGYIEGKNVIVEFRVAREPNEHPALIAELVNLGRCPRDVDYPGRPYGNASDEHHPHRGHDRRPHANGPRC